MVMMESATAVTDSGPAAEPDRSAGADAKTCMASLEPGLTVVAANDEFFQQFGRSSSDVCGRGLYELLHPGTQAVLDRHFAGLVKHGRNRFAERVLGMYGSDNLFSGELTAVAVRGETDELSSIVVVICPDSAHAEQAEVSEQGRRRPRGFLKAPLTELDGRILEGVAAGASTVQLANRLYLSRQGVEYHVGSMLRKLRVSNRPALVSRAYSMGLLAADCWPPRIVPGVVR
jgi:DNA-binding CsgD family transcriptional regulator